MPTATDPALRLAWQWRECWWWHAAARGRLGRGRRFERHVLHPRFHKEIDRERHAGCRDLGRRGAGAAPIDLPATCVGGQLERWIVSDSDVSRGDEDFRNAGVRSERIRDGA